MQYWRGWHETLNSICLVRVCCRLRVVAFERAPLTETGPDDTAQIDEQDHEGEQSNTTGHTLDVFYFLVPRERKL
jgi:hypothetical protein